MHVRYYLILISILGPYRPPLTLNYESQAGYTLPISGVNSSMLKSGKFRSI